jgi:hypothetical protein
LPQIAQLLVAFWIEAMSDHMGLFLRVVGSRCFDKAARAYLELFLYPYYRRTWRAYDSVTDVTA